MSKELISSAVQLLVSAAFAGLVVQLLLIRQNRRKIEGEASGAEANAAGQLSGAALGMVESARAGEREAIAARDEARAEQGRMWAELQAGRWDSYRKDSRINVLIGMLQQAGIDVPPEPDELKETPPFAPPVSLPPPTLETFPVPPPPETAPPVV